MAMCYLLIRAIDEKFGLVAFRKGVTGYTFIRERIVVIGDVYVARIREHFSFS